MPRARSVSRRSRDVIRLKSHFFRLGSADEPRSIAEIVADEAPQASHDVVLLALEEATEHARINAQIWTFEAAEDVQRRKLALEAALARYSGPRLKLVKS